MWYDIYSIIWLKLNFKGYVKVHHIANCTKPIVTSFPKSSGTIWTKYDLGKVMTLDIVHYFSTIAWGWSICQFTMRVKIHWTCVSAKLVEWWITPKKSTSHVKHSLMWPHGSTCVSDHPHPFPPSASMSPRWAPSRDRSLSRYPAD